MRKKQFLFWFTFLLVGTLSGMVWAKTPAPLHMASQQWQNMHPQAVQKFLDEINSQTHGYLPSLNVPQMVKDVLSGKGLDVQAILQGILRYLFSEVLISMQLLAKLVIVAVLGAILSHLSSAFERDDVAKLAHSVTFMAILALGLGSFSIALGLVRGTVHILTNFMQALLPMIITLIAGMGGITTAGLFHPLLFVMVNLVSSLVADVVVPLLFIAAIVELVGQFTGYALKPLASLLRQWGLWGLGFFMSLFIGVISIEGAAGPVADSLLLRSGKFLIGAFVPVVGKFFADATELVIGSSLILEKSIGIVGIMAIFFMVSLPLIKVIALIFIYRIAGALVAPLGAKNIADALGTMAGAMTLLSVSLGAVALMFFISLSVMLGIGGAGFLP